MTDKDENASAIPTEKPDRPARASSIPFELRSLSAIEAGELLGCTDRHVRERLATRSDFPKRVDQDGHPRWIAGELLEWRASNQACRQAPRRSSHSRSAMTANRGGR